MKKFGILVACAMLALVSVGCDDSDDNGGGGSGGGAGGTGGTGGSGPACGDGVVDAAAGEQCDPPGTATCDATCQTIVAAVCGDGTKATTEKCDDGNTADGDACSADCLHTFIMISGSVGMNPTVARWYGANAITPPDVAGFRIRAVDPILSLQGSPLATLASADIGADGTFAFATPVETTGISLGMVLTISDPEGVPFLSQVIADSTMGVCQPGAAAPQPDCSADVAGFRAYVVPMDFVRALETQLGTGTVLIDETEAGFVLGGVLDTNGMPIGGATATTPATPTTYFDIALQEVADLTDASTGAFLIQPTGIATLSVEKAGVSFLSSTATVGKSASVAFQVFFYHPVAAASCGNGTVDAGEDCEPPSSATCDETCHTIVVDTCGDGVKTGAEKCDDNNTADGDNCSADCLHTFISVSGQVQANPLAGMIHQGAPMPLPSLDGLAVIAIEPIARLANPGDPTAGVMGMTACDATGAFTMMVETTTVAIGLVVTVNDNDPVSTDKWATSTMGLCTPPCDVDLVAQPVYAVTDFANSVLEMGLAADLLSDTTGYILGMTLDASGGVAAPAGDVAVAGVSGAGPVSTDETLFLTRDAGTGAFIDNGTELTTPGIGTFISTHNGIAGYTATKAGLTFQIPTQQASASPGVVFQMFFIGL